MDATESNCRVLARFPDLNACRSDAKSENECESGAVTFFGRMFKQSYSVSFLSGLVALLLVASIVPSFFGRKTAVPDPAATVDSASEWQTGATPAPNQDRVAQTVASRPMTLVSAAPEQSGVPEKIPLPDEGKTQPWPNPTAKAPLMSSWPSAGRANDAQNNLGPRTAGEGAGRPMAVRPSEYQADARNAAVPHDSASGSGKNTNDKPAARNRYDSTRPSVY